MARFFRNIQTGEQFKFDAGTLERVSSIPTGVVKEQFGGESQTFLEKAIGGTPVSTLFGGQTASTPTTALGTTPQGGAAIPISSQKPEPPPVETFGNATPLPKATQVQFEQGGATLQSAAARASSLAQQQVAQGATNLFEYFNALNLKLPSLNERAPLFAQATGQDPSLYTGTAEQNSQILTALKSGQLQTPGLQALPTVDPVSGADISFLPAAQRQTLMNLRASMTPSGQGRLDQIVGAADPSADGGAFRASIGDQLDGGALGAAFGTGSAESVFTSLLKNLEASIENARTAGEPTKELLKAREDVTKLGEEALQRRVGIEGQPIPQPLIGGQLQALKEEIAFRQTPLINKLEALEQGRANDIAAAENLLGMERGFFSDILSLLKTSKQIESADRAADLAERKFAFDEARFIEQTAFAQSKEEFDQKIALEKLALEKRKIGILDGLGGGPGFSLGERLTPEQQENLLRTRIQSLPVGQQDAAFSAIATYKNARDIIDLIDKGAPTGIFAGTVRSGVSLFGQQIIPGTKSADPLKRSPESLLGDELDAAMTLMTANFIKAISGVQVSDRERQFLDAALPSNTKQENVNVTNVRELTDFLSNKYELQLGLRFRDFPALIPELESEKFPIVPLPRPGTVEAQVGVEANEQSLLFLEQLGL